MKKDLKPSGKEHHHYFKTKLLKMGKWALLPLDVEIWMAEETTAFFKRTFGFSKGLLIVCSLDDGYEHCYTPDYFFKWIRDYIRRLRKRDYLALSKKLKTFYTLKEKAKKSLKQASVSDYSKIFDGKLIELYKTNRKWAHHITIFDQFGWLGEHEWAGDFEKVLSQKLGLKKGSEEYNRLIFALTKPEHISTTLEEKGAVLGEVIKIKNKKSTIKSSAKKLADRFAFMPVFAYGEPWTAEKYETELSDLLKKDQVLIQKQFSDIKDYKKIRQREIDEIVKQYKISKQDLQIFIDFGLALDARNEAEYVVSYAGFYLMPMYREIIKRLSTTPDELRRLFEKEVVYCLKNKINPKVILKNKGQYVAWGFDRQMKDRTNYTPSASKELFNYAEGLKSVYGVGDNDAKTGVCASPGIAKGKIRIVKTPAENCKVQDGDILVTYATTVDYLPAMKKAAAIVTEVGGLTCHAAVVSREFNIPCVVSFSNAMSLFKDGQMVEVDANKGEIKVLK